MSKFRLVPVIDRFDRFSDFAGAYGIGSRDLLLTDRVIYETHLKGAPFGTVLVQDDFGTGEPTDEKIAAIRARLCPDTYDRVVAIGGGTVLDIAKLLATDGWDDCLRLFRRVQTPRKAKTLLLIPTTCGTGSEVTNISVAAFPALHTKIGLADDALYADCGILIAELLRGLPLRVFMHSSIDALIHAIEAYLSPQANPQTALFSARAVCDLLAGYRHMQANGTDSREALLGTFLQAANNAGIAFSNAGCGLIHAMSYPIGGTYHLPHGEANYEVMMAVLRFYETHAPDGRFASMLSLTGPLDALEALLASLCPRCPMAECGMTAAEARGFAADVLQNQKRLLANCYVPVAAPELEALYRAVL